jgi:hypothetical protein
MPAFLLFMDLLLMGLLLMGLVFAGHALFTARTGQSLTLALALEAGFIVFGTLLGALQYLSHKRSARGLTDAVNRPAPSIDELDRRLGDDLPACARGAGLRGGIRRAWLAFITPPPRIASE